MTESNWAPSRHALSTWLRSSAWLLLFRAACRNCLAIRALLLAVLVLQDAKATPNLGVGITREVDAEWEIDFFTLQQNITKIHKDA